MFCNGRGRGIQRSRIFAKPPNYTALYLSRDNLLRLISPDARDFGETFFAVVEKVARHERAIFEISKGSIPRDNLGRYFSGLIPLWHDKNVISIDHRRPFPSVLPRSLSRS